MSRSEVSSGLFRIPTKPPVLSTLVWPELALGRDLASACSGERRASRLKIPVIITEETLASMKLNSSSSLLKWLNSLYRPALAEESAERRSAAFQMVCWGVAKW